ncbi:MAG TPA: hypothetical protein VMW27_07065 [Thermoanaerobaculia bacterium]|nr:hypothetical protein [Thermoanaerobaculia bacterium]
MKKNAQERILGRKLARELTREELEKTHVGGGFSTWTLTDPADGPYKDNPHH